MKKRSLSAMKSIAMTWSCKAKAVPPHATEALGGGGKLQLLLILDLGTRWGEWSASRPGSALAPGKGRLVTPLHRRLDGPQNWSGHRG
jgi:hypothetical protein